MPTQRRSLKLAALLALTASAVLPAIAETLTSGPTSTVVYASGDDLVLKAADGKLLNFTIPSGYKFSANGKQVGIADLKPGTKLTAPVSAGTPLVVTSVNVVKGKVYNTAPPDAVTLMLPEGAKDLTVPAGTTFLVDGKPLTVSQLKNDTMVQATIVTTDTSGESASSTPPLSGTLLVAHTGAAEDLPAAGTHLPLFAALGIGFLTCGFALLTYRKPARQI
jgi:hypothetical protein